MVSLIALAIVYFALNQRGDVGTVGWAVSLVAVGAVAWLFYWLFSLNVSLHPEGITYQSCLGAKEMRWDEVEKFYYSATRQSVNFIPIGTYYGFRLISKDGRKISFGNAIQRPGVAGNKLIELTGKPLFQRLADLYNAGTELDFGPIKLSRDGGFRLRRLFRWKQLPLNQVASYRIDAGRFYIFKVGQKYASGFAINQIPNAFVLLVLLDSIYQYQPA